MMNLHWSLLSLHLLLIINFSSAQMVPPDVAWQFDFGGSLNDELRDIQLTPDGNLIASGYAESTDGDITNQHGDGDFCLLKTNLDGNIIWQKSYGGSEEDLGRSVLLCSDGGFILTGKEKSNDGDVTNNHGDYDFWVIKTDAAGNLQWQQSYGGSAFDNAYYVYELYDGSYLVSGFTRSTNGQVTNQHGNEDYWIVRIDNTGNLIWQKTFGGSGYEQASKLVPCGNNMFLICGYSNSVGGDANGNHGSYDSWLIKIDIDGNLIWQKMYGGSGEDGSRDLVSTPDGGFIIAGYAYSNDQDVTGNHGSCDIWIYKIDSAGNLLWQKSFGGSNYEYAYAINESADGNYLVAGYTFSADGDVIQNKGNGDGWIIKIDEAGNLLWQLTLGGTAFDMARDIVEIEPGEYYVAGYTYSNNGDACGNHGNLDGWMVKLCEKKLFYADKDHDGYGDPQVHKLQCSAPAGYVSDSTDCNDDAEVGYQIHPGMADVCNGIDDNCDGLVDENILPVPVINPAGNVKVCTGNSVTLTASAPAGVNYQWQKDNVTISGATAAAFTTAQIGDYSVLTSNAFDCEAVSVQTKVTASNFKLPPVSYSGSLNLCQSDSVVLQAKAMNGYNYQWMKNEHPITGAINYAYTATKAASYRVKVSEGSNCSKYSESVKVIKPCKAITESENSRTEPFTVFPDPSHGNFTIVISNIDATETTATIEIYNLHGAVVYTENACLVNGTFSKKITLNNCPRGVYLITVNLQHKNYRARIVVQ